MLLFTTLFLISPYSGGITISHADRFRASFISIEANPDFSLAVVGMRDGSKLHFCHRVDERWVQQLPGETQTGSDTARELLAVVVRFRLNAKHLEVQFEDNSRWELCFRA